MYEGMIVGMHRRQGDIPINVCKEKQADQRVHAVRFSLEDGLDLISADALV